MKKWKEKLLIFYLNTQVLQIQDVKDQTQKQIRIYDYTFKRLGRNQDKYVIKLQCWNNEKEYLQWCNCFSGEWQKKLIQRKVLEEFDRSLPEVEPYIDKQPLVIKSQAKPSLLSREKIQKMIPYLPDFIQKDMEIFFQNTLQNLDSFIDIQNFKQILDSLNVQLYQDTNDIIIKLIVILLNIQINIKQLDLLYKQDYKSLLIEEIYVECQDKDAGEKMLKVLLMNITSNDRNLIQIQEQIQQITENVITKNYENLDTLQISIKLTDQEIFRITSEQHQIKSPEEFLKLIDKVYTGEYINEAINSYSDQRILQGLTLQLDSTEEDGHFLYTKHYRVDSQRGGFTYHNERLLRDQRSVLLNMIKRIGSNIINGKSVMSVSLPIQIFESRSFLERMARAQRHAPLFLELQPNQLM
ncbi:unnamed protein product [Paramecium primaurelia]|uniref:Uncharacterized protein n=1 Tax=Paramecium primaurelia TaxID=5886 RepID=A0A8S1LFU8_PARPR|nr:unnamed protein product [Paramecium primaurelia]